jgi:hypothetical protein
MPVELPRLPGAPRGSARDLRGYLSLAQLEEEGPVLRFLGKSGKFLQKRRRKTWDLYGFIARFGFNDLNYEHWGLGVKIEALKL